jgi:hypothetical protein
MKRSMTKKAAGQADAKTTKAKAKDDAANSERKADSKTKAQAADLANAGPVINSMIKRQMFAVLLIIVIIANLVLYAMGKSSHLVFWSIVIIIALVAYFVLPKMNR